MKVLNFLITSININERGFIHFISLTRSKSRRSHGKTEIVFSLQLPNCNYASSPNQYKAYALTPGTRLSTFKYVVFLFPQRSNQHRQLYALLSFGTQFSNRRIRIILNSSMF